jgi:3,4-dihydroxy-2-butanone 4-phosphate synthase
VTAAGVNTMVKQARGLICLALDAARCEDLSLDPQPVRNDHGAADVPFTVTIEARDESGERVDRGDEPIAQRGPSVGSGEEQHEEQACLGRG